VLIRWASTLLSRGVFIALLITHPPIFLNWGLILLGEKMKLDTKLVKNVKNRAYLKAYLRDLEVKGRSPRTQSDRYNFLKLIFNDWLKKDFKNLKKNDLENLTLYLRSRYTGEALKSNVSRLRAFARFLEDVDSSEPLPKKYSGLKLPADHKPKQKVKPEDILTVSEMIACIKTASNLRDGCMFALMGDGGLRPHELLSLKTKDVEQDKNSGYMYVNVSEEAKTGFRRVRLLWCMPFVQPFLKGKHKDEQLFNISVERLNEIIKNLVLKTLKKKITSYVLRHSAVTQISSFISDAEKKQRFGWSQSSKMLATYTHLQNGQTDASYNRVLGIQNEEDDNHSLEKIAPRYCVSCGSYSDSDAEACGSCGQSLSVEGRVKQQKLNQIAYASAEKLAKIKPSVFKQILKSYGGELVSPLASSK